MSRAGDAPARGRGLLLAVALFSDYLVSPAFNSDVLQMLLGTLTPYLRGRRPPEALAMSMSGFSGQLLYRMTECVVVASMLESRFDLLRDAAMLHLLFQHVQQYHFYRCWVTRLFGAIGNVMLPRSLRRMTPSHGIGAAAFTPRCTSDPSESLPTEYKESLGFYRHVYSINVPYAVFAGGLVGDVTRGLLDQLAWAQVFYQSREKRTSQWRLLKPYLCRMLENVTQMALMCASRVTGVCLIRLVSHRPTDGVVFWSERIAALVASPFIYRIATSASMRLWIWLEFLHPATAEDEQENLREREEAEEAYGQSCGGGGGGGGGGGDDGNYVGASGVPQEDLYKVLGVSPSATKDDIKRAYRIAALNNHPDRISHDRGAQLNAQERMAAINQAYETLSSDSMRRRYDMSRTVSQAMPILEKFDNLSTPAALGIGMASILGLSLTASLFLYAQYFAAFHHLTSPGGHPLRFLGSTFWAEGR